MDYMHYSSQSDTLSRGNMANNHGENAHSIYGIPDANISTDADLFRGLSAIGSHFDAFNPFNPQDQFLTPHTDASHFQQPTQPEPQQQQQQQQQQSQQHHQQSHYAQPLQAPKSLSPDSTNGDTYNHYDAGSQRQQSNGIPSVELWDTNIDRHRTSSEERDQNSMEAQDRRKAQNRAAQRAFRERKEKHVKDLETKLKTLADASSALQADNERLKRELAALSTQNEILRATHVRPPSSASARQQPLMTPVRAPPSPTLGPQSFSPTEFLVATGAEASCELKFDAYPNKRGRMLLLGAAWDLIAKDKRVQMGQTDLKEVCKKLQGKAICDGRGPAFREDEVRQILDECSLGGMVDDLL